MIDEKEKEFSLKKSYALMGFFVFFVVTGCSSSKKLPYTPIDFPRYEWSFAQDGEVSVLYDVNADGRVENVRFIEAKPSLLFISYLKKKMIDDWRFEKNRPKRDVSVKVKFKH